MKLSAKAGDLAEALALADVVLAAAHPTIRKNIMLSAVRTTAADNAVSFTLNILDFSITTKTTAEVIDGEAAVSLKALSTLMTGCAPSSTINISTTDKAMTISADRGRFRLPLVPLADMPVAPVIEPENTIQIETAALMRLLKVMHTASNEIARFYLKGVFLHSVNDNLVAVGTDGRLLMRVAVPAETFSADRSCVVPLSAATVIEKLLKRIKPDKVTLKRSKTLLVFETPEIGFTTKLIDCTYPDYERIIPAAATNTIIVDSTEIIAALTRLAAVATKDGKPLAALRWQEGAGLELSLARQPRDGHDIVEAETTGTAQVAVPLAQLLELLEHIGADTLQILADRTSPLTIRPVGNDSLLALQTLCAHNFAIHETAA